MKKSITPMITVGIDIGDRYLNSCEINEFGEISETSRFVNSEAKLRERFEGVAPRRIVVEVGSHTRWIAELLEELGHEVMVLDPRRLKLVSGTLYKDDKIDAEKLAVLGMTAPNLLATVKLRDEPCQRVLTTVRGRGTLVRARTMTVNAIRGMLKPFGKRIRKSATASSFISEAYETLPAELLEAIKPMLDTLVALNASVAAYDKRVEEMLPVVAPDAVHLTTIYGVGALTALYFVALIGDPHRFAKSRDVGPYFGLCRKRSDSGDYRSQLGITKAGDSYMRGLLTNCAAHILGPFGKDSELRTWGLRIAGGQSRAEKKKAKVAIARKLAVLMLSMWKTGRSFEPFPRSGPPVPAADIANATAAAVTANA